MTTLRGALQGVFFLPCKVACLRGVVTLVSFLTLQIEFPYFASFLVSLDYEGRARNSDKPARTAF